MLPKGYTATCQLVNVPESAQVIKAEFVLILLTSINPTVLIQVLTQSVLKHCPLFTAFSIFAVG